MQTSEDTITGVRHTKSESESVRKDSQPTKHVTHLQFCGCKVPGLEGGTGYKELGCPVHN